MTDYSQNIKHRGTLYSIRFPKSVLFLAIILLLLLAFPYPTPRPTSAAGESLTISAPTTLSGTYGITATRFTDKSNPAFYFEPAGTSVLNNISGNLSGTATNATNVTGGTVSATTGAFSGNVTFPGSGIWNSSGNVGIGTTGPTYKLEVQAGAVNGIKVNTTSDYGIYATSSNAYGRGIYAEATGTGGEAYAILAVTSVAGARAIKADHSGTTGYGVLSSSSGGAYGGYFSSNSGTGLYAASTSGYGLIVGSGNVGIGTTGPSTALHVYRSAASSTILNETALTTGYALNGFKAGRDYRLGSGGASETALGVANKFFIFDNTAAQVRLVMDSSGYVGIGTTVPGSELHVAGTTPEIRIGDDGAEDTSLAFMGNAQDFYIGLDDTTDDLTIGLGTAVGTTPYMVIENNGNVGIGTTGPLSKLSVGSAGNANFTIYGYNSSTTGGTGGIKGEGLDYGVYGTGSTTGVYGTGSTTGVYGTGQVGVTGNGSVYDFYANGTGTDYGTSSSIRWKRNLQPIDNALSKVLSMRGLYYTWDEAHGGQHDMGMIAEEVGQYVPEIVSWDADEPGFATGMDYGHLTPVLVEAIKEQQIQIEDLKSQLSDQQKQIDELRNLINNK